MGVGFSEPPRGALGHWIKVKGKKIENYQAVVPSTWNASSRDEKGVRGQYEESLIGAPVPDPKEPEQYCADNPVIRSLSGLCGTHYRSADE